MKKSRFKGTIENIVFVAIVLLYWLWGLLFTWAFWGLMITDFKIYKIVYLPFAMIGSIIFIYMPVLFLCNLIKKKGRYRINKAIQSFAITIYQANQVE